MSFILLVNMSVFVLTSFLKILDIWWFVTTLLLYYTWMFCGIVQYCEGGQFLCILWLIGFVFFVNCPLLITCNPLWNLSLVSKTFKRNQLAVIFLVYCKKRQHLNGFGELFLFFPFCLDTCFLMRGFV